MEEKTMETKKGPSAKYKAGLIELTQWANDKEFNGKKTTVYSYNLQKNYQDKEGVWQSTQSLNTTDLLVVAALLQEAHRDARIKVE